jgi:signal peptidase I
VKSPGTKSFVNIRFVITISLGLIVLGCENQSNTPLSGRVQGMSMAPGFEDGDVISWQRGKETSFTRYTPVVCQLEKELIIKRVIGLPKESVRIADGELFINGEKIQKSPQLLKQFGLMIDDQADSWRDSTHSWIQTNNRWSCNHVSSKHTSWLEFSPESSLSVLHNEDGLRVYDDASWLMEETRSLNSVQDIGISVVLDIRLQEGNSLEVLVKNGQAIARVVVKRQGQLAVIAGRLDGQFVIAAWPIPRKRQAGEIYDDRNKYVRSELPAAWSARLNVPNKKNLAHSVPTLAVGIKSLSVQGKLLSDEPCIVKAEAVCVWRDIYWLATPNKTKWNVPKDHIFVLGDCPAASRDSRHWGCLPCDAIQGKVLREPFFQEFPAWLSHN